MPPVPSHFGEFDAEAHEPSEQGSGGDDDDEEEDFVDAYDNEDGDDDY